VIFEPIMDYLNSREVYLADVYAPPFIYSIGCHLFNIHNHVEPVYFEGGKIPHIPLHLCFTAPAGFMKSFFQTLFVGDAYSILHGVENLPTTQITEITTAGLIGGHEINKWTNTTEEVPGLVDEYKYGIIATEEFDAITSSSKMGYNSTMEHQLLTILDRGIYTKRTKMGEKTNKVFTTFWIANQPDKQINVGSGIMRRFLHLLYAPTPDEFEVFREKWWKQKGIKPSSEELHVIRARISNFRSMLRQIRRIGFDDSVYKFYSKHNLLPYECTIFDRVLIGHHLTVYGADEVILIGIDKEVRAHLNRFIKWKTAISIGADLYQIYRLIQSENSHGIDMKTLYRLLVKLNINTGNFEDKISRLRKSGIVKLKDGKLTIANEVM